MYISAWEKSALGKKRTRKRTRKKNAHVQENTTRKIIFISLLNSEQRHEQSNHCFNETMATNKDFFYPFVVCDIGRSRTLSLQFKLP